MDTRAADPDSSADAPRGNLLSGLLPFRPHRGASSLQRREEALMPMWICAAYGIVVVLGLVAAIASWLYAFTVGLAISLGGVFILTLLFFWHAMRAAVSFEPS